MGVILLVDEASHKVEVPAHLGVGRLQGQGADRRPVALPITIDASVALLDPNEAPRQIEVHELVTLAMQVHTLRRDVAGEEDAYGSVGECELFDDVLLTDVRQTSV